MKPSPHRVIANAYVWALSRTAISVYIESLGPVEQPSKCHAGIKVIVIAPSSIGQYSTGPQGLHKTDRSRKKRCQRVKEQAQNAKSPKQINEFIYIIHGFHIDS